MQTKHLLRDPRGGTPVLSAAQVLTIVVWGVWRVTDKAKLYFHVQAYHRQEFPALGAYSKFMEATKRYSMELRALLALMLHRNRHMRRVRQTQSAAGASYVVTGRAL